MRKSKIVTSVDQWEMLLHPNDKDISKKLYFESEYDKHTTQYLNDNISTGDKVVDIGAQIGYFTLHMASCVGDNGEVHSFEPHPINYKILNKNIGKNCCDSTIDTYNVAVYNKKTDLQLYVHPENKGMHSLVNTHTGKAVSVEANSGDNLLDGKIDLIKIDVEGAEPKVIEGMTDSIKANKPNIVFEYDKNLLETEADEHLYMLEEIGYVFSKLGEKEDRELSATELSSEVQRANIAAEPKRE